jgi:hypothetical protein
MRVGHLKAGRLPILPMLFMISRYTYTCLIGIQFQLRRSTKVSASVTQVLSCTRSEERLANPVHRERDVPHEAAHRRWPRA